MRSIKSSLPYIGACRLGARAKDTISLVFYYGTLRLLRKKGISRLSKPRIVKIRTKNTVFDFSIASLDDYRLLEEMFVEEQYRLKTEGSVKTIVDIGSNVGTSIIYFAEAYPEAHIYGFEPVNHCFELLSKTVGGNPRVTLQKLAIHPQDGISIPIYVPATGYLGSSTVDKNAGDMEMVKTVSIDSIVNRFDTVDILKIDVEGLEYEIFKNFKNISKVRYIIIEIHAHLIKKTTEEFMKLCPGFKILETEENPYTAKVYLLKLVNTRIS